MTTSLHYPRPSLLLVGCLLCTTALPAADSRLPVPDAADVKEAMAEMRHKFAAQYDDGTPKNIADFSHWLLVQGLEFDPKTSPVANSQKTPAFSRYIFLHEAIDRAVKAYNAHIAHCAIQAMARYYQTDEIADLAEALDKIGRNYDISREQRALLAVELIRLVAFFIAQGKFAEAKEALETAKDKVYWKDKILQSCFKQYDTILGRALQFNKKEADLRKQAESGNANACLELGRFLSFDRRQWEDGLSWLGKGGDSAFAKAALTELAAKDNPNALITAVESWKQTLRLAGAVEKPAVLEHISTLYRKALANADAQQKEKLLKLSEDAALTAEKADPFVSLWRYNWLYGANSAYDFENGTLPSYRPGRPTKVNTMMLQFFSLLSSSCTQFPVRAAINKKGYIGQAIDIGVYQIPLPLPPPAEKEVIDIFTRRWIRIYEFSIVLWIRPEWIHPELGCGIWTGQRGGDSVRFGIRCTGKLHFQTPTETVISCAESSVPLETWTHIAVTYLRGDIHFYINGEPADGGMSKTENIEFSDMWLSDGPVPPQDYLEKTGKSEKSSVFRGSYDEVCLWFRALDPEDIRQLYRYSIQNRSYAKALVEAKEGTVK